MTGESVDNKILRETMLSKVPAKVHEINNKAFDLGLEYARQVSS